MKKLNVFLIIPHQFFVWDQFCLVWEEGIDASDWIVRLDTINNTYRRCNIIQHTQKDIISSSSYSKYVKHYEFNQINRQGKRSKANFLTKLTKIPLHPIKSAVCQIWAKKDKSWWKLNLCCPLVSGLDKLLLLKSHPSSIFWMDVRMAANKFHIFRV